MHGCQEGGVCHTLAGIGSLTVNLLKVVTVVTLTQGLTTVIEYCTARGVPLTKRYDSSELGVLCIQRSQVDVLGAGHGCLPVKLYSDPSAASWLKHCVSLNGLGPIVVHRRPATDELTNATFETVSLLGSVKVMMLVPTSGTPLP